VRAYSILGRTSWTSRYNPDFSVFRCVPSMKSGTWTSWNQRSRRHSMSELSESQRTDLEQINTAYLLRCPNLSQLSDEKPSGAQSMGEFLEKWANLPPARPLDAPAKEREDAAEPIQQNAEPVAAATGAEREQGKPWAEWKAAALNRLFQEQGTAGLPGRITAATVRHGEAGRERVDSAAPGERPMSRAEARGR
jgi:hypothetical protein